MALPIYVYNLTSSVLAAGLDALAGIVAWLVLRGPGVEEELVGLVETNAA